MKLPSLCAFPSHIKLPYLGIFVSALVSVPFYVVALFPHHQTHKNHSNILGVTYLINTEPTLSVGLAGVSLLDFWKLLWLAEWKTESSKELPFLSILIELTAELSSVLERSLKCTAFHCCRKCCLGVTPAQTRFKNQLMSNIVLWHHKGVFFFTCSTSEVYLNKIIIKCRWTASLKFHYKKQ